MSDAFDLCQGISCKFCVLHISVSPPNIYLEILPNAQSCICPVAQHPEHKAVTLQRLQHAQLQSLQQALSLCAKHIHRSYQDGGQRLWRHPNWLIESSLFCGTSILNLGLLVCILKGLHDLTDQQNKLTSQSENSLALINEYEHKRATLRGSHTSTAST